MSIACHSCHCIECQPRQNGYSSSKGWDSSSGHSGTNRCLPRSKSATAPSVCGASKCALLRSLHLDPPLQASGTQRNSKELEGTQSRKEVDEVPFFDSNLPLHCHFPTHGLARVGRRGCSTATSWVVDAPALVSGRTRTRRISFMMVYVLSSSCYMGPGLVYRTSPAQMTQTQRKLKINR
jgi:hypothetical protein